jgi:cell wall-associated NlpC family hydrolase
MEEGNARPMRLRAWAQARVARMSLAAVAGLLVAVAGTTHAYADPSKAELEAQIDTAWNKLEPVIEQYNKVHTELVDNQQKAAALQAQIAPLQKQIDDAQAKVAALGIRNYKEGRAGALNTILRINSPGSLPEQLSQLEAMARKQNEALTDVVALRNQYDTQKRAYDDLVARLSVQDADVAAQKAQIENDIKTLNDMRLKVYGTTGARGSTRMAPCPVTYPTSAKARTAVVTACAQIDKPYVFGSEGPNTFDCSGLMLYAWNKAGVTLRHYTKWQWDDTKSVNRADLQPGDLVFYYSDLHHVGMYIGKYNGVDYIVNAPHSGDVVRVKAMDDGNVAGFRRPG